MWIFTFCFTRGALLSQKSQVPSKVALYCVVALHDRLHSLQLSPVPWGRRLANQFTIDLTISVVSSLTKSLCKAVQFGSRHPGRQLQTIGLAKYRKKNTHTRARFKTQSYQWRSHLIKKILKTAQAEKRSFNYCALVLNVAGKRNWKHDTWCGRKRNWKWSEAHGIAPYSVTWLWVITKIDLMK